MIKRQKGFGLPEVLIAFLVVALLGVLALPRVALWRTLSNFEEMQKQIGASFNEARQEAILQGRTRTGGAG